MRVRTVAPAKINWTLEVLGKRDDGYHEIKSVMQTIDLCDEVKVWRAPELIEGSRMPTGLPPGTLYMRGLPHGFYFSSDLDFLGEGLVGESVTRAVRSLDPDGTRDANVDLSKKILVAAGLGGGSSDAAAALRLLDRLWELGLTRDRMVQLAAESGSDVAFFLSGGTALVEGRGERITPLQDVPTAWLVVVAPSIRIPEKTKRMYSALKAEDLGDGRRTEALIDRLKAGKAVSDEDMCNAFGRVAYETFAGLAGYRDALVVGGAGAVHLAGSGPALFSLFGTQAEAQAVADRLETDARVFVVKTLGAEEATRLVVSE